MSTGCKASNDSLEHQKSASEETSEFSKLLSKMYSEQLDTEQNGSKWPHSSCALKNSLLSRKYVESCVDAHNIIQASCSTVCREEGLDPYKGAALTMGPAVEETCKLRNKMLTDFDSYRRRLKTLEAKKASTEVIQLLFFTLILWNSMIMGRYWPWRRTFCNKIENFAFWL